jgi:hypothetical protein
VSFNGVHGGFNRTFNPQIKGEITSGGGGWWSNGARRVQEGKGWPWRLGRSSGTSLATVVAAPCFGRR